MVVSSFTLANAFSQLPAGWLADRIGTRMLITVGILGVAIAGLLVGLSQTYVMLLVFLMLMGLAGGGYHPAATPMISMSVEPHQRGRALGFHLLGGNASVFLTPIIAAATAAAWGWRMSFIGLAVPTAIFGIFFHYYMGRHPGMNRGGVISRTQVDEKPPAPGHKRRLISFLFLTVLGAGFGMSIMAFLPLYVVDRFGASEQAAASLISVIWSAGLWAGPVGGYLSDRVGRVPVIVVTHLISGVLICLLNLAPWGMWFIAVLLIMGISSTMRMPVAEAFILEQTGAHNRSTIYGFYYFTMGGTGAVFAPIMGYVCDNWGFGVCFTLSGVAVIALLLVCAPFLRGGKD